MHAPAKTPPAIVGRLNKELVRILALPDIKTRLKDLGSDGVGNSPDEFAAFVAAESARYGKLIKELGLKAD
jgi:tripartite-type tricarboxylate transporter receptor subunit TctC